MTVELTPADYPLSINRPELLRTPTGKALSDLTMAAVVSGEVTRRGPARHPRHPRAAGPDRRVDGPPAARGELHARLRDDRHSRRGGARHVQLAAAQRLQRRRSSRTSRPRLETTYSADHLRRPRPRGRPGLRGPQPARRGGLMTAVAPQPTSSEVRTSKRTEVLEARPVNLDGFVEEWPEEGLVAMESDFDPQPSVRVEDGRIVELDGRTRDRVRLHGHLHRRPRDRRRRCRGRDGATPSIEIARMLVDPRTTRAEVVAVGRGLTPAKILDVVKLMNVVEIMMGMQKMRARRTPANQAHSTSAKDNPIQVAADAAEAALRGFAELETTLGVVRYAPLVAIALHGRRAGRARRRAHPVRARGGHRARARHARHHRLRRDRSRSTAPSRCSSTATTPPGRRRSWPRPTPRAASRCASPRAPAPRCRWATPRAARCCTWRSAASCIAKGAGVQGLQNGSISCIGVPGAVPGGHPGGRGREPRRELAGPGVRVRQRPVVLALRRCGAPAGCCRSCCPAPTSCAPGYSAVPNYDNMFAGSNFDAEDYDDWNIIQRDLQVDGGLRHVRGGRGPGGPQQGRARAAGGVRRARPPADHRRRGRGRPPTPTAATTDPDRDVLADLEGARSVMDRGVTGLDLVKALEPSGFGDVAENCCRSCASASRATCCRRRAC